MEELAKPLWMIAAYLGFIWLTLMFKDFGGKDGKK